MGWEAGAGWGRRAARAPHTVASPQQLSPTRAEQHKVWPCHFPEGWRLLDYPQDGRSGWAAAMLCRVPCRLLLTAQRGDAGCEAGPGWKGASCNQEMYCGCWAARVMQRSGDKAQKSARLRGDAGGDLGEGDADPVGREEAGR